MLYSSFFHHYLETYNKRKENPVLAKSTAGWPFFRPKSRKFGRRDRQKKDKNKKIKRFHFGTKLAFKKGQRKAPYRG
jgi:hypothetical protein